MKTEISFSRYCIPGSSMPIHLAYFPTPAGPIFQLQRISIDEETKRPSISIVTTGQTHDEIKEFTDILEKAMKQDAEHNEFDESLKEFSVKLKSGHSAKLFFESKEEVAEIISYLREAYIEICFNWDSAYKLQLRMAKIEEKKRMTFIKGE